MNSKSNLNNVYLPTNSKNHTYYPIETKRQVVEQSIEPPPQPTIKSDKHRDKEIQMLRRANEEMRQREDIYIEKLMKLEEGLEIQYSEFIKLQELYTELFESYKQKQLEITELELKFRASDRYREPEQSNDPESKRDGDRLAQKQTSQLKERDWVNKEKQWQNRQRQWKNRQKQLVSANNSLNERIQIISQTYEKMIKQQNFMKAKDKMSHPRGVNDKMLEELQQWQKQADAEKESRLKYQYQNDFLKKRITDLEGQRNEIQSLLTYKQQQLTKLRQEKIKIQRQSSEKFMNRSPSKDPRIALKTIQPSNKDKNSDYQSGNNLNNLKQSNASQSQFKNSEYFSFSRQKESSMEQSLPSFPPELEIDSLINQHKH